MASKNTAGRTKKWLAVIILFGPAFLLVLIGSRSCEHKFMELDDYGLAPGYTFTSVDNKTYTEKDFEGDIILINMIKPECPANCNFSFWYFDHDIYQRIRKNKKKLGSVKLISYVIDNDGNTVDELSSYNDLLNDKIEGYNEDIWMLAGGNCDEVYNITSPELRKEVEKYFKGTDKTSLMILLDKENHYRAVIDGRTESNIRTLKQYLALLQKEYDKKKRNE